MNTEYINRIRQDSIGQKRFKLKFPEFPDLKDKTVLDFGCGYGEFCVNIALQGAEKVVGIDINNEKINYAKNNIKKYYPELANRVQFYTDISKLKGDSFDIIISKAVFHHVLNLEEIINKLYQVVRKTGKVYVGFSNLYNSPFGDHKRTKINFPWGHLLVPENIIFKRFKNRYNIEINNISELGLNKLALKEYKKILLNSKFKISFFKTNVNEHFVSKLFLIISKVPFLSEFFSYSLYFILEK